MNRRNFIRLAGGGLVLAAAAGGIYGYARSVSPVPASAIAAWREAGQQTDPRHHALAHAILAPNPHNMQPWKADVTQPGEIAISLDEQRLLPATDPFGRQILMGLGAFLELLKMAAAQTGHAAEVNLFPDGEPGTHLDGRRMAHIVLRPQSGVETDPLFSQVLTRRTDRRAYDFGRGVTSEEVATLVAAASPYNVRLGVETAARLNAIKDIARKAWYIELTTEAPMMESVKVLRVGSREIDVHRDGIVIDDPMLVLIDKIGLFDRAAMPAPDSQAVTAQITEFNEVTASTPGYLWITTEGNSRRQQVEAGAAYVCANLTATALGLSLHPNQQALQEYPEVAEQYAAIHQLLDAPSPRFTVQMLARLGHPAPGDGPVPPAPRRGLDALLG